MLPVPPDKSESKRQVRFEGICADATKLGVSREHLYRVLTGQRISQSLLRRYEELKRQGNPPPEEPVGERIQANPPPSRQSHKQITSDSANPKSRGLRKSTIN